MAVTFRMRAEALRRWRERRIARGATVALTGVIVMPDLDPLPVPPEDLGVENVSEGMAQVLDTGSELRQLMAAYRAGTLTEEEDDGSA